MVELFTTLVLSYIYQQLELAKERQNQALEIYQKAKRDTQCTNCFGATSHVLLDSFYYYSYKPRKALKCLNQALQIKLIASASVDLSLETPAIFL